MADENLFQIKQGSNTRPLVAVLSNDLTGATARFKMANGVGDLVVDAEAFVTTESLMVDGVLSGVVEYDWQDTDLSVPGNFRGEFWITYDTGEVEVFPADGYISIQIEESIPLEEPRGFTIDTTGAEKLCTDQMIRDLLTEVTEFPGSIYDAADKLAQLKVMAKANLEAEIGQYFFWKDITAELHDGNQKPFLFVLHPPIISVTQVKIWDTTDGVLPPGTPRILTAGVDYFVYDDHIAFLAVLPRGAQNVSVNYRSGISKTNSVSLKTGMTVARMCALMVLQEIAISPSRSSGISAGPVSLRESFDPQGKWSIKRQNLQSEIMGWIKSKWGFRMTATSYQQNLTGHKRIYDVRRDSWN